MAEENNEQEQYQNSVDISNMNENCLSKEVYLKDKPLYDVTRKSAGELEFSGNNHLSEDNRFQHKKQQWLNAHQLLKWILIVIILIYFFELGFHFINTKWFNSQPISPTPLSTTILEIAKAIMFTLLGFLYGNRNSDNE